MMGKQQYLHQATYGNAGGVHTAKPMFVMKNQGIYRSEYHPEGKSEMALYSVKGNHVYATGSHPNGPSLHALYKINGDKIHTTMHHPEHNPSMHAFELHTHL
jgi:hypothetical protein